MLIHLAHIFNVVEGFQELLDFFDVYIICWNVGKWKVMTNNVKQSEHQKNK